MPRIKTVESLITRKQELIRKMDLIRSQIEELDYIIKSKNRSYIENYKIIQENQKELIL